MEGQQQQRRAEQNIYSKDIEKLLGFINLLIFYVKKVISLIKKCGKEKQKDQKDELE